MVRSSIELIRSHWLIFAVLAVWTFTPLVALIIYGGQHGDTLIGTNSSDMFDQFQYLAWIRDAGSHVFASDLWQVGHTSHDYLQPMYVFSGLLWRLGASIQVAYLFWKPVAMLVLFLGCAAYVRHLFPGSRAPQAAALVVALFYLTPALALAHWTGHLSLLHQLQLNLATADADSALGLWGFDHTAIAIGLMPVFLIACERLLEGAPRARRYSVLASVSGLLVAWLHPWQALMLLGIVGGLFVFVPPRRRYVALAAPVAATMLPLIYGVALSHFDPVWSSFQAQTVTSAGTAPWWALLLAFGPLGLLAALAVRRPHSLADWMLLLWIVTCALVYFLVPQFPPHALSGLAIPLAVMAVRGWPRLHLPSSLAIPLASILILGVTVPSAVYHAQAVSDEFGNTIGGALSRAQMLLHPDEARALHYLSQAPRRGGVLAPWYLSMSVPGFTGRPAYAGHPQWQSRSAVPTTSVFFDPHLSDPGGHRRQAILKETDVTFVLADCRAPATLTADIAPLAQVSRRFGCVTVYQRR